MSLVGLCALLLLALTMATPLLEPHEDRLGELVSKPRSKRDAEQYYAYLCALYGICDEHERGEKRLASSPFHGIPKFGKRAFTSAFSGIPKFG